MNATDELDLLVTDDNYAETVTISVDVTVLASDLPGIVQILTELPEGFDTVLGVDFPKYSPLPWEHTLPIFRAIFDEGN